MKNQVDRKQRNRRRILISAVTLVVVAAAVAVSFLAYASQRKGQYVDVQEGYILKRLDAQDTYVVWMPAEDQVSSATALSAKKMASEPVTLTYNHSEKGREHNWDIYADEAGNRYTYHEETGQLVSIEFHSTSPQAQAASAVSYPTEEEICAFAERYMTALMPQFDLYGLASCMYTGDYHGDPNGRYLLSYGVPVGDYYGAGRIPMES